MGRFVKASSSNVIRFYEQTTAPTALEGITLGDMWVDSSGTPTVKVCTSISPVTFASVGGGGGDAAPSDAKYVVLASNGTLTNESVLAVGSSKLTLTGSSLDIDTAALSTALNLSGTNTGDQTNISGNAGTVTNGVYTTDVGTVTNTMLAGSIANDKLANSAVANLSGTNTGDQTLPIDSTITITDNTTNNASTTQHGWCPKLSNVSTEYLSGTGVFSVPAGGSGDSFKTISVSGQSDVVADSSTDTLTLVAGSGITITTNAGTDTITLEASSTSSFDYGKAYTFSKGYF